MLPPTRMLWAGILPTWYRYSILGTVWNTSTHFWRDRAVGATTRRATLEGQWTMLNGSVT